MPIQRPFASDYIVEEFREFAGCETEERLFYPGASPFGGRDGLMVRVAPATRQSWVGCFAFGLAGTDTNVVTTCPNPGELCVVSAGDGYIVRADDPQSWESVRCGRICDVKAAPAHGLLIFADDTNVVAYGCDGLQWQSPRVSSDGVELVAVDAECVEIVGWHPSEQKNVRVFVSLQDGEILSRASV